MKKSILLLAVSLLCGQSALADVLIMENGDTLSGTLLRTEVEHVTFKPAQAEKVKVEWKHVKELRSDNNVMVLRANGDIDEVKAIYLADNTADNTISSDDRVNPGDDVLGKSVGIKGYANLGLQFDRGNQETDDMHIDAGVTFRYKDNRLSLSGDWEAKEVEGVQAGDKWIANAKYDYFFSSRAYAIANLTSEEDEAAELENRTSFGAGVGYVPIKKQEQRLEVELLATHVEERFINDPDDDFIGASYGVDYVLKLYKEVVEFYFEHDGIVDVDNTDKVLLKLKTGVRAPIAQGLLASVELKSEVNTDPPEGAEEETVTTRFKIGYIW